LFGAPWTPSIEGTPNGVLPDTPANLIASGKYNKAPLIVGTNKNEMGLFQVAGAFMALKTTADLEQAIDKMFPNDDKAAAAVKAQYTAASDDEANGVYIRLLTDLTFRCPTRSLARMTSDKGSQVYLYSYEEGNAYHSEELAYVFGMALAGLSAFTGNAMPSQVLMDMVPRYWTHFAETSDPNVSGNPAVTPNGPCT
jgi:para-nitrobenzyl esterase